MANSKASKKTTEKQEKKVAVRKTTSRVATKTTKKKTSSRMTTVSPKVINNSDISLEGLLQAGCHFGHSVSKVNPRMQEYIFTAREGTHIFDLIKTKTQLEEAIDYLVDSVKNGGKIIFLGTKRQATEAIEKAAQATGMFYVNSRWIGGLLTNWLEVKKNLNRLEELDKKLLEKNPNLTKYEISVLRREQRRLQDLYGGLVGLEELPQDLFIVDPKKEQTAVREAKRMGIGVAAIVDTNTDPTNIDQVIPANDDAQASVEYILDQIVKALKKIKHD
jgi:small subunit ribosomal protein S2